jgi:deoxycytidine triphosphate deaminase
MNKKDWPKLNADIAPAQGFLVDRQISAAISQGQLISQGAEESAAKYACYELHTGARIRQLVTDPQPSGGGDLYREKVIPASGEFLIGPGETFTISAAEELNIPADVFAITVPVGNMYRLGLNPETSFADPGFSGEFYVTVCNYSTHNVRLKVGDPLARVFFFRLAERPDRIHESKPRQLPPAIEPVGRPSQQDLENRGESALLADVLQKVSPPHYEHAYVTDRMLSMYRTQMAAQLSQVRDQVAVAVIVGSLTLFLVAAFLLVKLVTFVKVTWPDLFGNLLAEGIAATSAVLVAIFFLAPAKKFVLPAVLRLLGRVANE